MKPEINVSIDQKLRSPFAKSWFVHVARSTLDAAGMTLSAEMGLVITNSEIVRRLNKNYRGKDELTDVLAFHMVSHTQQEPDLAFVAAPDGLKHLGEVIISYPQAVLQAQQQKHSEERELALLIVHGTLHLLGYDHMKAAEKQLMRTKEKEILGKLGFIKHEK